MCRLHTMNDIRVFINIVLSTVFIISLFTECMNSNMKPKVVKSQDSIPKEYMDYVTIKKPELPTVKSLLHEDSLLLSVYIDERITKYLDFEEKQATVDFIKSSEFGDAPYTSIGQIDRELHKIINWNSNVPCSSLELAHGFDDIFLNRLMFHLSNSLTFRYNLPLTTSVEGNRGRLSVLQTPDRKYNLYNYCDTGWGTITSYSYINILQYKDSSGNIRYNWWPDHSKDFDGDYYALHQFTYKGETHYVFLSCNNGGSSMSWNYCMEIATIDNGRMIFHANFFPEGNYEPHTVSELFKNKQGEWDERKVPAYDVYICGIDHGEELDVEYDPATKTVSYNEYYEFEANGKGKEGKFRRAKWSLVMPK